MINFGLPGKRWLRGIMLACLSVSFVEQLVADSPNELEKKARGALTRLYRHSAFAADNVEKAFAVLVFPEAKKLALGVGVETGTGVLFHKLKPLSFYNLTGISCGLELGIQKFGYAIFFMTEDALNYLDNSRGLELGFAPSLVVGDGLLNGAVSTTTGKDGILAFTFNQTGLMLDVGVHVAKFTEYEPGD